MPTPNDFSDYQFASDNSAERGEGKQGVSGEYGQAGPQSPLNGNVTAGTYPNLVGGGESLEFSSDKASTPEEMAVETAKPESAFAELQNFLMNNLETPGSRVCHYGNKPWTPPHGAEGE
jgi:hypothetical protein